MKPAGDYYELLGVPSDATSETLRFAYREIMRRVHPDVSEGSDAAEMARAVNQAYRILANPETRARYDQARLPRPARVPADLAPANPRANQQEIRRLYEQDLRPRQSWKPFVAFALLSTAGIGVLLASGVADPSTVAVERLSATESVEKQTNDLVLRIGATDLRDRASGMADYPELPVASQKSPDRGSVVDQTPISGDLAVGAGTFTQVMLKSGWSGAKDFSVTCHQRSANLRSLREADRCLSFDFTASYVDAEVSAATLHSPQSYFQDRVKEPEEIYRSVGLPATAAGIRSSAIKRVVLPMIVGSR